MNVLQRKFHIWPLPKAAKRFNRMERSEQLERIAPHIQPFTRPITAFIFLPDICVIADYKAGRFARETELQAIYAVSKDEGLYKLKNTPGAKYMWHHLEPEKTNFLKSFKIENNANN